MSRQERAKVIQGNLAAWIALYRTSPTERNAYWTFNGRAFARSGPAQFLDGLKAI